MQISTKLEEEFAQRRWFHSIDFGEFASSGRFRPGEPQNITLFGFMDLIKDIDLRGHTVLDIGSVDGLSSFGMKALGASEVHATDSVEQPTFLRTREVLDLDVNYHPGTQIKDVAQLFNPGTFDLILCAGVIYHMLNPASAFFECRKIIKDGGLLVMETPYFKGEERAAIFVNSETEMVYETSTYSVPTKAAVIGLMKLAGFDVLGVRTISSPDRVTVLGRALSPERIRERSNLLERIHEIDFCDFEFRLKDHLPPPAQSSIIFFGEEGEKVIDYKTYAPSFPYHPSRAKRTAGSTMWASPKGNR